MFKWFRKNERGSVMVVFAVALVVLLGATGLAVDFGSLAMTRQELQNAADAAALAAGMDRMEGYSTATATTTANSYINANGYTPGDGVTTSNVSFSGNTVTVTISTKMNVGFSSILTGRSQEDVSATAVAEVNNGFAKFPYALFAGDTIDDGGTGITGNGGGNGSVVITGNVHSNTDVSLKHATVNGSVTAYGDIEYQGRKENNVNNPVIPMPGVNDIVEMCKNGAYFDGDVDLKKMGGFDKFVEEALPRTTPGPNGLNIYVNGNIKYNGNNGSNFENTAYPINLVVRGNITLGGIPLRSKPETPFVLISETGNVEVNGQGTTGGGFYGLVFASEGDVTLNGGNESHYYGSIYARNITKNGGGFTVTYDDRVDNHLPKGKVRLIA